MQKSRNHRHSLGLRTALAALVLCLSVGAVAQDSKGGKEAGSAFPLQVSKNADVYDVDASSTDISLVLQALSRCSGANMVVSPDVGGAITANLKQMPLDAILDYLSTVRGFAWKKSGDTYLVAGKDLLAPPATTEQPGVEPDLLVWQCRHIRPSEAVTMLKGLFPKITVVEGPSCVTPKLDSSGSGLGMTSGSSEGSGSSGYSSGISSSTVSQPNNTRIVLVGDAGDIERAKKALTELDVGRDQVFIKVAITEVGSSGSKELGIDWAFGDLVVTEDSPASGINFGKFTREGLTVTGAISALMKDGKARLLAQPNISVLDGECASILIGDRILFPKLIGYSQFGTPIYDKEEEKVGIYLQIAPKVTDSDEILMTLYPQVSLVTSFLKTQAGDYPQISTREARTTVSVKNGETLAIGGLLRDDDIKTATKVPILGDIPIIGEFFKRVKTTTERTEIVILLTPVIATK